MLRHVEGRSYEEIAATLPATGVTYYPVPAEYGVSAYRYTVVNNRPVLVEPGTRRIVQVMAGLASEYDVILVDTPSAQESSDALVICQRARGALIVGRDAPAAFDSIGWHHRRVRLDD